MAGKCIRPCCPPEPKAIPLRPQVAATTALAPAKQLWTTNRCQAVRLRMEDTGPAAETPLTVHQAFLETVQSFGDHPALAHKEDGQWVTLSWRQYYEQCRAAAKSFLKLGLERYHGVGILGFNAPEWFIADMGCIFAGGLATGIYSTNTPLACLDVAGNSKANILVVENQKQLDKILQIKNELPHLRAIVQYKGELQQQLPSLYTWADFMKLGEDVPDMDLDDSINSLRANECCTLIYTSGATGPPKEVMLSHDNLTWTAHRAGLVANLKYAEEIVVSYLPLSRVAAHVNDMYITMRFGATTYFAEPDAREGSLVTTLKEVSPTSFLGVPRIWEKMQEKMKAAGAKVSPLKKSVADWAKSIGLQYNYSAMNGENRVPWGFMLANQVVFKKVQAALGLGRCRTLFTGSAPISKDTLDYFMSVNMPLMELYGMSESTGPHTMSTNADYQIGSCGKAMAGCKVKIDKGDTKDHGEICFWGRNIFMGYLNNYEETEEVLDQDGWLHSGEVGELVRNFLFITRKTKESTFIPREDVAPVPIENFIKAEVNIISNAMLIDDKYRFLSMLLTLKCVVNENGEPTDQLTDEAIMFCREIGVSATKVSEIMDNKEPAVYKAIREGMERVNAKAASIAQVQKFVILGKDFSIPGGELGPTMKLRRAFVVEKYRDKIHEMYSVEKK
ncbi:long-chain-fatty-acid--CoA ligase ACSBG2-like isoform X1 [Entelurus aequoreus]|uniref:long-chain-fatty-acid--CoA ligase ACSBG2-like isoform X1 n=1 Tax=Entelurus aequoreus TaxID=161455 RepID=UPI002B1CFC24|nr:long-chain-fatty-acid--CoA ligase ACSBG2-like isoform X1 [Entelurus aequoreus]